MQQILPTHYIKYIVKNIYSGVQHANGIDKEFKNISPQSLGDISIAPSV